MNRASLGCRFATGVVSTVLVTLLAPAWAAACELMAVNDRKQARLIVYFTKFPNEDKTDGKYRNCKLVRKASASTQTFKVTPFRRDANVVVLKKNWPR